ncbi:TldD/PmbA family protein [Treponema sp.]
MQSLGKKYDFLSILATDCAGTNFEVLPSERRISESIWTERGFVARAVRAGRVVEHSFDTLPAASILEARLEALFAAPKTEAVLRTDLSESPLTAEYFADVKQDPFSLPSSEILDRLAAIQKKAAEASPLVVMARSRGEWARFSKLYVSKERTLEQSFLWGQCYIFVAARRDGRTKQTFHAVSGRKGLELLDELGQFPKQVALDAVQLLDAQSLEAGEYTVLLSPDMAGLLAHEAFGHGVETDMYVKSRAKAAHFVGKRVGSPLVSMYDGALSADQNGSYLFDDEGTEGGSTLVLDKGILVAGLSDRLSAEELKIPATGNGRRWTFERKAYARMTNTFFSAGSSSFDDLISGIDYGWLLDRPNSGMEDPKNWGIQLVALVGREIKDGRLTGRIVSPVVCTGSVPDVLNAVDAVADTVDLRGNGYCGKGHKELAKVSSGGPWVRTKMRLG